MKIMALLFMLTALPLLAGGPAAIELDYFPPGANITLGHEFPIYWMWEPGDLTPPPTLFKLELHQGGTAHTSDVGQLIGIIAQSIPLGNPGVNQTGGGSVENGGVYIWKAGTLLSGLAPAGNGYCVRAVTMDRRITSYCYYFNLVEPPAHQVNLEPILDFVLAADPLCPMCGVFDIGLLLAHAGYPPDLAGSLVLLRDGQRAAVLGRLGPAGLAPGQKVNVRFAARDMDLIRNGGLGFMLAIIGDSGRNLYSRPIRLKFSR